MQCEHQVMHTLGLSHAKHLCSERLLRNLKLTHFSYCVSDANEGLQTSTVHSAETVTDLVPDPDQEAMNAMVLAIDQQLSKDCRPLGVDCRVGDPVLLSHCGRCVDDELISILVKSSCCLHLHSIVTCSMCALKPHQMLVHSTFA